MIGVIVVTHSNFGKELIEACESVIGKQDNAWHLNCLKDDIEGEIEKILDKNKSLRGFIILVDLFGGTPCNVALKFAKVENIQVISGVNLPMLASLFNCRQSEASLKELVKNALSDAKNGILDAKEKLFQKMEITKDGN